MDSDQAFARALELDSEHWESRSQMARNKSFWPAAYGGQAEAIRQFETLIRQQERGAPEPRFASTYLWLGNLYDQQGRTELAQQVWSRGLGLFPDDSSLADKLDSLNP